MYHDQSYHCPIDRRGPIEKLGNMTSVQGMADYFYKAQTENPDSVHGTEHMTEVNNVGASLGIVTAFSGEPLLNAYAADQARKLCFRGACMA